MSSGGSNKPNGGCITAEEVRPEVGRAPLFFSGSSLWGLQDKEAATPLCLLLDLEDRAPKAERMWRTAGVQVLGVPDPQPHCT